MKLVISEDCSQNVFSMAALLQQAQMVTPGEVIDDSSAFLDRNSFDGGICIFEIVICLRLTKVTSKIEVRCVEVWRVGCPPIQRLSSRLFDH